MSDIKKPNTFSVRQTTPVRYSESYVSAAASTSPAKSSSFKTTSASANLVAAASTSPSVSKAIYKTTGASANLNVAASHSPSVSKSIYKTTGVAASHNVNAWANLNSHKDLSTYIPHTPTAAVNHSTVVTHTPTVHVDTHIDKLRNTYLHENVELKTQLSTL